MMWRVAFVLTALGAVLSVCPLLSALQAQASSPPSVQIANGAITATVYLPDAANGFYRGTRFDWAGVIGRLESRGHTYYAPWFNKTDATVRDFNNDGTDITAGPQSAVTGPAEEFSPLGFAEAAPRGTFVKIGVGVLRKPDDGSDYTAYRSYEIVDAGKRTVATRPDGADFTQEVVDTASGFGYRYTKTLRLNAGRPELVIAHRLVNQGRKPIGGTVYNHNFLVLDGQPTGPDFVITAPFELKTARPVDPAQARIEGKQFFYASPISALGRVSAALQGFGPTAADYRFTIENRKVGAGVEIVGDRPLKSLALWSIRTVLALEPFIDINIAPGAEFTWEYTYRYYATQ